MSEEISPVEGASPQPTKSQTFLVVGAVLVVLVTLLYLYRMPAALHWPIRLLFAASLAWLGFSLVRKIRSTKFDPKIAVFSLVLIAILYGFLFLICHLFVKLMSARDESLASTKATELTEKSRRVIAKMLDGNHPAMYDREVGWVPRPDYLWKDIHTINEQGIRGKRVYPETPGEVDKRILCVGDSFTFGYEVADDQTFAYHGEQLVPGTEWINLGITGTGLTQSLAHYRKKGREFGGKYVVIAFMTNNGKRTVNCFRPFVSPSDITPFAQPFAKMSDGKFSIEPNPYQEISDYRKLLDNEAEELKRLYELDYFTWSNQHTASNPIARTIGYVWERQNIDRNVDILLNRGDDSTLRLRSGGDPYGSALWHPDSPGCQAILRLFDVYYEEVVADGRVPLIVILPSGKDVESRAKGLPPKHVQLIKHFEAKGYRYFDFLDSLEAIYGDELDPKDLYGNTHFNGPTNKLVAEEIIKKLELR